MEIMLALIIVVGATAAIPSLSRYAGKFPFSPSRLGYLNTLSKYQTLLLGVALLVLVALYFINEANLVLFLAPGHIAAPANAVAWLGIPQGDSWLHLGASLSVLITLATSSFVYWQFRKTAGGLKNLWPFLPWVLLFSLSNSFSEEVIYRLGVVVPLAGVIDTEYILLLSALAFGAPHLRGMPNGILGAMMAGLLGWLLAKSVVETSGFFWAWFIHFLQDVVIFSAFVLAAARLKVQGAVKRA